MYTTTKIIAMTGLLAGLVACSSPKDASKSNFSNAIQAYMDTQKGVCIALPGDKIPFTLQHEDPMGLNLTGNNKKNADALVDAGLLSRKETRIKRPWKPDETIPASEYQLTDEGRKYFTDENSGIFSDQAFCTGKYTVVDVDNFTEPSDMMGVKVSQVNFRYKADDLADWAKSDALRAANKDFSKKTQGDLEGSAALVLTNDGWVHEQLFRQR